MINEERYLKALRIIKDNYVLVLSKEKSDKLKYNDYTFVDAIFKEIEEMDKKNNKEKASEVSTE